MLQRFKKYYLRSLELTPAHKVLLTVSGGVDSMVMLHVFRKAGYPVEVAHCNFHLRGGESDRDQAFV